VVVGGGKPAATAAVAARFGDDLLECHTFRGQETIAVGAARIAAILRFLREQPELDFDFLTDLCAVHYPDREYQYEVVYHLYSFRRNRRLRVKARIFRGDTCPTAVEVYPAANWPEREAFDMVGVRFEGHPDLRRILMPEGYEGHPLRRDFPLTG
jgi:NADH-quinone oxidoreductase subunit C